MWSKIAKDIMDAGYKLGESPGEKCRQKFANLQKGYLAFIQNAKQTGAAAIKKPWYFEAMDCILGEKHILKPVFITDSERPVTSQPSTNGLLYAAKNQHKGLGESSNDDY